MKKIYTNPVNLLRLLLPAGICFLNALSPATANAQTYYSNFPNPSGKFSVTLPSGDNCNAPVLNNITSFSDGDLSNYTSFKGVTGQALNCDDSKYALRTYLKLPADSPYVSGGIQAGFRIKVSSSTNVNTLVQHISIQTLLNDNLVESFSGQDIRVIDLGIDRVRFFIYANTTKNFNQVQLTVDGHIIPLNTDYEFDILYALASNLDLMDLLPVTISNYKAIATGNNVVISWQSLNEVNVSNYRVEKSSNNGASYTTIATIPAKGGSDVINYNFTDKGAGNGNYLYRIVSVDKDGAIKATNAALVTIAGKTFLTLMPSIVKAGQTIVVNNGITGTYQLAVFDLQGRMIKQQQVNSGDKATVNTNGLSAGTYVVKIMTTSGTVSQAKFIIN